jgi:hypothetical protein
LSLIYKPKLGSKAFRSIPARMGIVPGQRAEKPMVDRRSLGFMKSKYKCHSEVNFNPEYPT